MNVTTLTPQGGRRYGSLRGTSLSLTTRLFVLGTSATAALAESLVILKAGTHRRSLIGPTHERNLTAPTHRRTLVK